MKEVFFYDKLDAKKVRCRTCYRNCEIPEGGVGYCRTRKNLDGKLFLTVYGKAFSPSVDPIEKKPFFHFKPGAMTYSFCTPGCNFHCLHCFAPETTVVTNKGAHRIEEVYSNNDIDSVLTKESGMQNIKHRFEHHYKGPIIEIQPKLLEKIRCTPDHKFFVSNKKGVITTKEAQKITLDDYLIIPNRKAGAEETIIDIVKILSEHKSKPFKVGHKLTKEIFTRMKQLKASGRVSKEIGKEFGISSARVRNIFSKANKLGENSLFIEFYPSKLIIKEGFVKFANQNTKLKGHIKLEENLAYLLGLYCAEGCIRSSKDRPNSFELNFAFGHHEEKLAKRTKQLLKIVFDVDAIIKKENTTLQVRLGNTTLALFFKLLCGKNCYEKQVPEQLFNSNHNVIGSFIKGYLDGDGYYEGRYIDGVSVSKKLILGIAELLLIQGVVPAIYSYENFKYTPNGKEPCKQRHIVRILQRFDFQKGVWKGKHSATYFENDDYFFVPIREVKETNYNGEVFNFEIDNDHSYTANFFAVHNCCNATLSQGTCETVPCFDMPPEKLVGEAKKHNTNIISYTYTEPTIFFEYAYDTGVLARKKGMLNAFVTNGYATTEVVKKSKDFLDAVRVDLKGDEKHYKEICGGVELDNVLNCIKDYWKLTKNLEIITLVIEGDNNNEDFVDWTSDFLKKLSPEIPWHFIPFFPTYKMLDTPVTSQYTLRKMRQWALEKGMKYVYGGDNNTYCPNCNKLLIERTGFHVKKHITEAKCFECGHKIKIDL